ncbi:Peroxidase [Mycena sanguinolenta]|uniref:Peroxidase n=1 Tax=Mycena sanguinolenta TaxID=230812 RepID=A0A8H7DIU4_9AGAR|nr:Peroxidase [Mycena sanguinolenta]
MFIPLLAATLFPTANGWTYPNPQLDALDALRWDQIGYNSGSNSNSPGIASFIAPCTFFTLDNSGNSGRSDAADWIRTAYHDMATYNQTDGTGGLDASIRFGVEQARPENVGDAFNNTLNVVSGHANRYISVADTIALAAIMAFENCGGPQIAFRGGRVDATEPNAPGVPQPQDTLDAHIADFSRSGFTQTEMISLVACGHSFGGVQHAIFPDIVPDLDDPTDTQSVQHFDTTFTNFDNNIASEYIAGTTQNPLVVGANDTTNSDKRIFGSDGNVTMLSFANSADLFALTCSTLIARMLDTVPSGVQLTEVVTPPPVKIWNSTNTSMAVVMLWDDHNGATNSTTLPARRLGTSSAINDLYKATWYGVDALTFDGAAGITTMRFTVNGEPEDQNGLGFPVQDSVLFSTSSCSFSRNPILARIDVAVRNGVNATRVFLEHTSFDSTGAPVVTQIDVPPPTQAVAVNSAYSVWSTNLTDNLFYTIGAEVDGTLINPTWANQAQNFKSC